MLERQALINEGLIDPEGFDDFRVVRALELLLINGLGGSIAHLLGWWLVEGWGWHHPPTRS